MFSTRSARFAIQPFHQHLAVPRRWPLFAAALLAVVCFGAPKRSAAVVQNQPPLAVVSAASNEADALAPESLATAYGLRLATQSDIAPTPQPQLAGTTVNIAGLAAPLLFVSPEQVNFLVPAGVPTGLATVTVRSGDGAISTGTTNINAAAPALFTTGGVVSGFALRVKADGAQSYEPVAEFDSGQYKTKAIDLNAAAGDQVFLIFFLSGLRGADPAQVRVSLGGDAFPPVFAGAVPGVPGLDQINLLLPRGLVGKGVLNLAVTAPNARPSNVAKVEIGGGVTTLAVSQLSKQTVLAGETMEILGANLPTANVEVLFEPNAGTPPDTAAPDKLTLRVPFGAASGLVKIAVNKQVAWTSPQPISVRTSISGFIQDTNKQGIAGLAVSVSGTPIAATTNRDGAFVLPDVGLGLQRVMLATGASGLPFPANVVKQNVIDKRDNQLARVEINRDTGVVIFPSSLAAGEAQTFAAPIASAAAPEQQSQLMLTLQPGTTIRCPDGSNCPLTLTPFAAGRTPVDLPPGYFSSSIAQLSPFRATITPGGKLKFPNADNLSPGASVRLFKFEQDPASNNLGEFRDITAEVGAPVVTASSIETTANAIRESSYYFVSPQWPVAAIIGHVVEADGVRPVRRAIVSARGQSTLTDGNGGFVLRNVPVIKANDGVTLEIGFNRADGTVARAERAGIAIGANAPVQLSTDIVLPPRSAAGGPLILAPATLTITEGETREFNFIVIGLAANALPTLSGPSFATLRGLSNDVFALRLAPPPGSAGSYQITLAAGNAPNVAQLAVAVTVSPANTTVPIAQAQAVTTDEDTPKQITLTSANTSGTPIYSIITPPLHGAVSLNGAIVIYSPSANYNGTDSFSFKVGSGNDPRSIAVVAIAVRPVNDPPVITSAFGTQNVGAGQTLKLTITATDPDGDPLILTAPDAPAGAMQNPPQITPTSWQFSWTPTVGQAGNYVVSFKVSDTGSPALSDTKAVAIVVSAKWAKTAGPEGGTINALFSDGTNLFAGTDGGEIYRSGDQGQSWAAVNTGLPQNASNQVLSLIGNGPNLFAGTQGSGVFRSTNQGQSWAAIGLANRFARAFALSGASLFVGTDAGVFVSTNQGQSFTAINTGLASTNVSSLAVTGTALFAGIGGPGITGGGVFVSTNQGNNWTAVNSGLTNLNVTSLAVIGANVFAGTLGGGVFVSTNQGQNWTAVNSSLGNLSVRSLGVNGTNLFAGTDGGGIFRSTNQGQSWTQVNSGLTNLSVKSFAAGSANFFAGTFGGVFRSSNLGNNWAQVNAGLTSPQVFALAASGTALFAGANGGGIAVSLNNGQNWTAANNGLANQSVRALAVSGTNIFAGTSGGGVFLSSNQGQSWTAVNNGLTNLAVIALTVSGTDLYAGSFSGGVFRSTNQGQNWTPINAGLTGQFIRVLAANGSNIFAGTEGGGVFRLANQGSSWTPVNTGLTGQLVRALAVSGATIFAGTVDGGAFISTNQGNNWSPINTGLTNQAVNTLAVNGTTLFAGTFGGIFVSGNQGQSWTAINSGLTNPFVLAFATADTNLFAGAAGGVFRLTNQVQSWDEKNTNLTNKSVNAVATSGTNYLAGTLGGVFRSADQGANWVELKGGLPPVPSAQSLAIGGASLFVGTLDQGVYRSTDDGNNWTAVNGGLPTQSGKLRAVYALKSNKASLLAGTEVGVYRLDNFVTNSNWTATTGLPREVRSLLVNNATVYAGTFDDGVYRSSDDGQTWQAAGKQGLGNLTVLSLGIGVNGTSLFAGTDAGIYRSDDGGQSWRAVNRDLPTNLVVTSFSTSGTKLYTGSVYGVFLSEDNGENWKQINAGLLDTYVTSFALSGDKLIAGTKAGGVFISRIPDQPACVGIAAQPASKTITGNQTTVLSITPSGNQPFQFQWYQGASGDFSRPITGATTSTFTTPQLAATTNYWVLVTNGCGSASSETASVIVNATPQADLAVTQTISPAQPRPGDDLTFTLTVSNLNTNGARDAAFAINVTDALPAEVSFTSCGATGGGVCGGVRNNRSVSFASLAPNASATITLVAKVNASAGGATLRNTASVSSGTSDTNAANNTDTKSITVQNTAPAIASLNPNSAVVGGPGFTLTVNGANFTNGAKVAWNGAERETAFGSATQLTAQIPASDLAAVGTAMITVANPDGQVSGSALFAITLPPRLDSLVRVVSASGGVGGTVSVPIQLVSQGDENALGFSLTFDPATLGNPQAALGSDAAGATINPSGGQAAQGRFGVLLALPAGQRFVAGTRQVVVVTFTIAANTTATTASIGFGDQPVMREVSDINGNVLSASYAGGVVTITHGLEADVAPRPDGNGSLTVTDWVLVGRFASGDLTATPGSEFQRADCAPRGTFGDGRISLIDWVQAGRYAAGLDPPTPAGGPSAPTTSAVADVPVLLKKLEGVWPRLLRVSTPVFGAGQTSAVTVELLAQGEENAVSFSLRFDARQWRFVSATAGEGAPDPVLSVNPKQSDDGRVGFALALPPGRAFEAGLRSLVVVTFAAAEGGGTLAPEVVFGDQPAPRELADVKAATLAADWMPAAREEAEGDTGGAETPRLFTANEDGQGVAAGVVIRVGADGVQRFEPLAVYDPVQNRFVAAPIELSDENEQVYLALFGTGWQNGGAPKALQVTIDGMLVEVVYAGAQGGQAGLNQLNLRLPRTLNGRGEVTLQVNSAGLSANPVNIVIK